jgi:adhesin transport system outer membrane protein
VRKAVIGNPEVQASWHAFTASAEEQEVARGGYRPSVDVVGVVGREHLRDNGQNSTFSQRDATLRLSQMVYDGFATRSEVARLGYVKLARYYEVMEASENAALETVRAYEDVRRYRELITLAQDNYVQHRQVLDQIAERARAGVGRRVDLEQATGRLALAESNLLTEASNLHDVSARYLRIVGEVPAPALEPAPKLDANIPPAIADALRLAYSGSPAYGAAVEAVRAAQMEVEGRRARYQPRVDLRASAGTGFNLEAIEGRTTDRRIEMVVSYNLYNGGSDSAAVRQHAERLNQARDLRDKACRDLRQTLSIAYNDVSRLDEQLRYLDQHQLSIAKAREAYRKQFDIGQRTLLDLLDTENEYFQARRAYVNARFDRIIADARAQAAMGRLLETLEVRRADLPSAADVGQDRQGVDPATACPAEAPGMPQIDKEALFAEAMRKAGGR